MAGLCPMRAWRASMRPPLNAGENIENRPAQCGVGCASMRPPLNAGENLVLSLLLARR